MPSAPIGRGCCEISRYFFVKCLVEEILILLLRDKVILELIFNCVISTFIFNEMAQIFC